MSIWLMPGILGQLTGGAPAGGSTLLDGLTSWYTMEEASGTRVDAHGGHDLTDAGAAGVRTGSVNQAVDLTGAATSYLTSATADVHDIDAADWSAICWLEADDISGFKTPFGIVNAGVAGTNWEYILFLDGATLNWHVCSGSTYPSATYTIAAGTRYCIYVEYNASTGKLGMSVDAGPLQTVTVGTPNDGDVQTLFVGAWKALGRYHNGLIDELAIYKGRILTASEIRQYMTGLTYSDLASWTLSVPATLLNNLISWWTLDEESGTRVDSHGAYDLTDNNTVLFAAGKQGNAADFEATSTEYLDNATTDFRAGTAGNFSYSTWFKTETNADHQGIIHAGNSSGAAASDFILAITSGGVLTWYIAQGGAWKTLTGPTVSIGTWYHVVIYYNAATDIMGMIVDNDYPIELAAVTAPNSVSNFLTLGYYRGYRYFNGMMDETTAHSEIPTPGEVLGLYFDGAGITYTDIPVWTPANLDGLYTWVSPDINTMYQDSAKTTPVTARGDQWGHGPISQVQAMTSFRQQLLIDLFIKLNSSKVMVLMKS